MEITKSTTRIKISDIFITKERPERDGIEDLASSIETSGYLIHPPILYKDEQGRLLVAAGRRRIRAFEFLKREYIDAFVFDLQPTEVEIIRIEENLRRQELTPFERARHVREIYEIYRRLNIIPKKEKKGPGRPTKGISDAIEKAAKVVGRSQATVRRDLKVAEISKNASEMITGTKIEENQDLLLRIAQQPKETHLRIVSSLQSGLTFEESLRRLDRQELKGHDWPDDYNDIFIHLRKELFFLANKIRGEYNKNFNIIYKHQGKKHKNQIARTAERIKRIYQEMIAILELSIPQGPCPYCEFKGCEKCSFDGYADKELLVDAEKEGIEIKKYYFDTGKQK